jgi:hypothetical protein
LNVLLQAARDACHGDIDVSITNPVARKTRRDFVRKRSRAWFRLSNDDFRQVCELAGIDAKRAVIAAWDIIKAYDAGVQFDFEPWIMNDVLLKGSDRQLDTDAYYREGGSGTAYLRPANARRAEAARGLVG